MINGRFERRIRAGTYQASFRLDERSILPVHFVVESAGVAEVVPGAVPPPERRRCRAAVDALAALCGGEAQRRSLVDELASAAAQSYIERVTAQSDRSITTIRFRTREI